MSDAFLAALIAVSIFFWHDHSSLAKQITALQGQVSQLQSSKDSLVQDDANQCGLLNAMDDEVERIQQDEWSNYETTGVDIELLKTSKQIGIAVDSSDCVSKALDF